MAVTRISTSRVVADRPARSGTELAKAGAATTQPVHAEAPAAHLSRSFINAANKLDREIIEDVANFRRDAVSLGEKFGIMLHEGYHRGIFDEAGNPMFLNFEDYLEARWPETSKSQIWQSIRIVRSLTSGDNPVASKDDIREMTKDNAEGLAKLKKQGVTITPQLIEKAKEMPIAVFKRDVVQPQMLVQAPRAAAAGSHKPVEPQIIVKRTLNIGALVDADLQKAKRVALRLTRADNPEDKGEHDGGAFDDRWLAPILAEFLATHLADYEAELAGDAQASLHRAVRTSDAMGPDMTPDDADDAAEEPIDVSETAQGKEAKKAAPSQDAAARFVTCQHVKEDTGVQCNSPAVKGLAYCYFHQKHYPDPKVAPGAKNTYVN